VCQNPINARKGITTLWPGRYARFFVYVRILLMPVRALRLVHSDSVFLALAPSQNPINARKGITTPALAPMRTCFLKVRILLMPVRALRRHHVICRHRLVRQIGQNPINARKGITTSTPRPGPIRNPSVRILLMPVRALRLWYSNA